MIAVDVLSGCPGVSHEILASGLFFKGELECERLRLKKRVTLVVSVNNPGADRVAEEIAGKFSSVIIKSAFEFAREGRRTVLNAFVGRSSRALKSLGIQFFVLYLNKSTFLGEAGDLLAAELREFLQHNPPSAILLLHENTDALEGCEFARWRSTRRCDTSVPFS